MYDGGGEFRRYGVVDSSEKGWHLGAWRSPQGSSAGASAGGSARTGVGLQCVGRVAAASGDVLL